jgi:predicted lipoprotein with Yx(FWY)xxD motif
MSDDRSGDGGTGGRRRWGRRALLGAAFGTMAVIGAACSSGSSTPTTSAPTTSSSAPSTTTTATATAYVVGSATRGSLGAILVDHSGATLYRYTPDGTGKSTCTGGCATVWPPLTVLAGTASVAAGTGIPSGTLGTTTRSDGTLQVTYKGMPLYTYAADTSAGQTSGQGVGGTWYVVSPSGAASTTTTTARASGY